MSLSRDHKRPYSDENKKNRQKSKKELVLIDDYVYADPIVHEAVRKMWEFSHSDEAYSNLLENLYEQSRKFLLECAREIKIKNTKIMSNDTLAECIFDFAMVQRICDNGGFNAWVCPNGCHTVSFERIK